MSNIIKSFRIIETEKNIETEGLKLGKETDSPNNDTDEIDLAKMISESEKKAGEIIDNAKNEAKALEETSRNKRIMLIEEAKTEAIKIEEEAKIEGYSAGYSDGKEEGIIAGYEEGKAESLKILEEANLIKKNYLDEEANILKKLEPKVIELVIEIYEKVLGQKIANDENVIVELVASGIKNLDPIEKLTIISSKDDYEILGKYKERILAEASLINELDIKYDINLEKGDCILETEKGSIDISIKEQLKEVELLLKDILSSE